MKELAKAYEASKYEKEIYQTWEKSGYFNPDNLKSKGKPFTISLPPPNATGILHLGHATMLAVQDLIVRFQRLGGRKVLWLPGTDHASIATQNVVEKKIWEEQKKTRFDIPRDEFVRQVAEFAENSRGTIKNQMRCMGVSCDWSRDRYTLDAGLSQAVREAFVKLYKDDLIYRGKRIVNWCTRCGTTLADDEVEYKESVGKLYYIKYGPVTVATTRPETKLGDTALAVNPDDERYRHLVGKEFDVTLGKVKVHVKVIADKIIDKDFGTGVVGVTPAHSVLDYELAQKYHLPLKIVISKEGTMTEEAGIYTGLKVKEARGKFVADLGEQIEKIEEYKHNLSICYRCSMPIEPMPLEQWFVAVDKPFRLNWFKKTTLKQLSLEAVRSGQIKIVPDRFEKVYYQWMENLHDWCISRQIWFGHRVPVWYRKNIQNESEIYVGVESPLGDGWQQDPDTLDTWFSSSLWTFSTLGWPEQTKDLQTFHPTSVMETGYDILFFWVARMILMTKYILRQVPFRTVYLHGLVRDKQGKKMSKSLGNGIDPVEMIEKYGADALRLSMVIGNTPGNDFRLYEEKIAGYRNFVNKLWNICRYILLSVNDVRVVENVPESKTLADKWILSRFRQIADLVTNKIEDFQFSEAGEALYDFTWHELADWYLEVAKLEGEKDKILSYLLTQLLKLWHPYTPFITEVLWREAFGEKTGLLMVQPWPQNLPPQNNEAEKKFDVIKNIVIGIRNYRSENKILSTQVLSVAIIKADNLSSEASKIIEGLRTKVILVAQPESSWKKLEIGKVILAISS
jgi:valyl-tRNA synthetase